MKHIGILAHSAEGAGLCFLAACHEGSRRLGAHNHPDLTLAILPMARSLPAWERADLPFVRGVLLETAERLARAGADFWICPDNTAHIALELPGEPMPIPGLHIAEIVARQAVAEGRKTIGVLGTKWTMEGPVYRDAFARHGLAHRLPSAEDREMIQRAIFDELCCGVFPDATRVRFLRVIEQLRDDGCDAAALVCTEIPLLVTPGISPLPALDSTRLLSRAAVAVAVGDEPMPGWRGGPPSLA